MEKIAHFCQKCRAANEPGEASCRRCGTRLMIVTLPPALRLEEEIIPSFYEDHLLERVSLLEFKLAQVSQRLALAYEFIARQTEDFEKNQKQIERLLEGLSRIEPELAGKIAPDQKTRQTQPEPENPDRKLLDEIRRVDSKANPQMFAHLVEEGVRLLESGEEKQAFSTLERAALLAPENIPLRLFIAEKFFDADKFQSAEKHLEAVCALAPHNLPSMLLLSAIYADAGRAEDSRKFLSVLVADSQTQVCANYVWGILAAYDENWSEALVAFKTCLEQSADPEIFYLAGCAFFQLADFENSHKFLEKAFFADSKFADARFMQSVVLARLDRWSEAREAKTEAFEIRETGAKCLGFFKDSQFTKDEFAFETIETALPFRHFKEQNKRLLTNASVRLNKFVRRKISESLKGEKHPK